jgi:hypothetical protein
MIFPLTMQSIALPVGELNCVGSVYIFNFALDCAIRKVQ